ncbi:unnamed protein product, partial [Schistosoma turkestanicum]
LNNEFTNDCLHSLIRKDIHRLETCDFIHQSSLYMQSTDNEQNLFNDNIYDIYQIIIDNTTIDPPNENDPISCCKYVDNDNERRNFHQTSASSASSTLLTTKCYLSNIWSFSQLLIELIVAHLLVENKHKFIEMIRILNRNHHNHHHHNFHCYPLDMTYRSSVNLHSALTGELSNSMTPHTHPPMFVCNFEHQQQHLQTNDDKMNKLRQWLVASDRTTSKCQTLPNVKQRSINDPFNKQHLTSHCDAIQMTNYTNLHPTHSNLLVLKDNDDSSSVQLFCQLITGSVVHLSKDVYFDHLCKFMHSFIGQTKLDELLKNCRHPCQTMRPSFEEIRRQLKYAIETITASTLTCTLNRRRSIVNNSHIHETLVDLGE